MSFPKPEPPGPEIYRQDGEKQHGIDEAIAEYLRL
jgi:Predicted ATPase